jgi:predicted dehydrogenase
MPVLKLGLVGCGQIVQSVHLNILTQLPNVELVALAEPDARRRQEAAERAPSAAVFADYHELLARPDVEAVVICLPNALHAEVAVAALQKDKHIYLEKPLALSLEEGQRVLNAWRRAGTVGMIGFNYRYNPLYQAVRQQLEAGSLGELVSARSVFSSPARTLPTWKQKRQSGGGVLLDLASHHIDLIRFFFGQEIREVFASVRSQKSESDTALLQLRLANDVLVQSFFSMCAVDEDRFEIYGQSGKLAVDRYHSLEVELTSASARFARLKRLGRGVRSLRHGPGLLKKVLRPGSEPSYHAALAHFVAAAQGNQPATPDLHDSYRSLAVIVAAEQSAITGRVVDLTEVDDLLVRPEVCPTICQGEDNVR